MLVVAVISVNAFLVSLYLTFHLEVVGIGGFSGCTLPSDTKDTLERELGSSDQKDPPSVGKNTGIVLVPCCAWKSVPYSYFCWCGYFQGPWVSFLVTDEFSVTVTKNALRIGVSRTHSLPFCSGWNWCIYPSW